MFDKPTSFVNFMGKYPFHFVRKSVIIQKVTSILTFILTKNQRIFQKKCENNGKLSLARFLLI